MMWRVLAGFLCIFLPLRMAKVGGLSTFPSHNLDLPTNQNLLTSDLVDDTVTYCYPEYDGCLKTDSTWYKFPERRVNLPPQPSKVINTTFILYTRNNTKGQIMTEEQDRYINCEKEIKILVHGYEFDEWMKVTANELLRHGDYIVIAVDWLNGSGPSYTQATANTRVVALAIVYRINCLMKTCGLDPRNVHIIGHSLGAHIAGYVGERVCKIGRITGMDPAGPYFENMPLAVRLDPTDAIFVDIIHTNGCKDKLSYGTYQLSGNQDFYPNGGCVQPACPIVNTSSILDEGEIGPKLPGMCNHIRSIYLFTDSINSECPCTAYACENYQLYLQGKCSANKTAVMGYNASDISPPGKYFLKTSDKPPYCCPH